MLTRCSVGSDVNESDSNCNNPLSTSANPPISIVSDLKEKDDQERLKQLDHIFMAV